MAFPNESLAPEAGVAESASPQEVVQEHFGEVPQKTGGKGKTLGTMFMILLALGALVAGGAFASGKLGEKTATSWLADDDDGGSSGVIASPEAQPSAEQESTQNEYFDEVDSKRD